MRAGDIYKNIHTGELLTVQIVAGMSGLILFRNSANEPIVMGFYNLNKSWEKQ